MLQMPAKCRNSSAVAHTFSEIFLHSTIVLELPCSLFAVYCITNMTPKRMFVLKVLLLTHQLWVSYYSFMFNVATTPFIFVPDIVMYTRGVLNLLSVPLRVQCYFLGLGFAGMMLSILGLFAYRHQCVLREGHWLKMSHRKFVVYTSGLHLFSLFYMVPILVGEPDQAVSIERMQQEYADPPCDLWSPHIYVFFYGFTRLLLFYAFFVATCSTMMVFYIIHSFRSIRNSRATTSKSTRKKQIGFLYALILMAVIPNVLLCFPVIGLVVGTISGLSYHPAFGELLSCCLSVHGLASTITLIMSVKPYKTAAATLFRRATFRKQMKQNTVQIEISTKSGKF